MRRTGGFYEFNTMIMTAASVILVAVQQEMGSNSWIFAVSDVRWSSSSYRKSKTRVHVANTKELHSMHTPIERYAIWMTPTKSLIRHSLSRCMALKLLWIRMHSP